MINIPNSRNETLQQLLPRVQESYPEAKIKKVLFFPETIVIPYKNFKFVVRRNKETLKVDHTLPVLYAIGSIVLAMAFATILLSIIYGRIVFGFGGAIWIVLGIFIMKYVFQRIKKQEFDHFRTQMQSTVSGFDFEKIYPETRPSNI